MKLDILNPKNLILMNLIIFLLCFPKILSNEFEYKNYEKYLKKYYIDALKIIESKIKKNIKIFIPSTVYISNNNQNFDTYTKVKNNLENIVKNEMNQIRILNILYIDYLNLTLIRIIQYLKTIIRII